MRRSLRRFSLLSTLLFLLAPASFAASAQGPGSGATGIVAAGETVIPRSIWFEAVPLALPAPPGPRLGIPEGEVPMGEEAFELLKRNQPRVDVSELGHYTEDRSAAEPSPSAPTPGTGFEGIMQGQYIPSEPCVAVGPDHVLSTGNVTLTISGKDGSGRTEVSLASFFAAPAAEGAGFDPLCFYDIQRGRYLVLAETKGTSPNSSFYYLGISKTSDARGGWWIYKFDQTKDGTTSTANWSDFPGLGISDDKLVMSGQQFTFSGNSYQHQKLRTIDRALAYAGSPVTYVDIYGFGPPPGGDAMANVFVTKPGRNVTPDPTIHVFTTRYSGGSNVAYRTLTGPPSAPVLSAGNLVTVSSYALPDDAPQLGGPPVPTGDVRTPNFYVRDGILTIAWHFGTTTGGSIRLFRMRTSDRAVLTDESFGASGIYYYYPAACVDVAGSVFIGFDRSSPTEFSSAWATGRRHWETAIEPSTMLKAGTIGYVDTRWGDYTGIDMDENASGPSGSVAWYAGQWAKGVDTFGTWLNKLTFTYGGISGSVLFDCDGSTGTAGDRSPLAGAGVTVKRGATTLATATSDAAGAFSIPYVDPGTYDLIVTPGSLTAVDALPGSGGTSQTRISSTDVQIVIAGSQVSSGNTFLLTGPTGGPTTTSIDPYGVCQGDPAFTLTVNGSGFLSCSVVRLDGSDRVTTYVSPTRLTAAIPTSDIEQPGQREITVFNPGGGGVSNPQTLQVCIVDRFPPFVDVSAPNGGETWTTGTTRQITWNAFSSFGQLDSVNVDYSIHGGAGPWIPVGHRLSPNSTPFDWIVPDTPTDSALVQVSVFDPWGQGNDLSDALFRIISSVGVTESRAAGLSFASPSPNPARLAAGLSFTLPAAAHARLELIEVTGRRVWHWERELGPGSHEVTWNGRTLAGERAAPGLYLARLVTPWGSRLQKLIWMP